MDRQPITGSKGTQSLAVEGQNEPQNLHQSGKRQQTASSSKYKCNPDVSSLRQHAQALLVNKSSSDQPGSESPRSDTAVTNVGLLPDGVHGIQQAVTGTAAMPYSIADECEIELTSVADTTAGTSADDKARHPFAGSVSSGLPRGLSNSTGAFGMNPVCVVLQRFIKHRPVANADRPVLLELSLLPS